MEMEFLFLFLGRPHLDTDVMTFRLKFRYDLNAGEAGSYQRPKP